jgi:hypothetical protein
MARRFTFTVKEGAKRCFLVAEGHGVTVQLAPPADIEHAKRVAAFLNENLADIFVKTGSIKLESRQGIIVTNRSFIDSGLQSLFGDDDLGVDNE